MERFLRFYIKFHGYSIGIATILGTLFLTVGIYRSSDFHFPLEEYFVSILFTTVYNYRFMGSSALIFGAIWLAAGLSLIYGIFTEKRHFLYPFVIAFMLDLFLMVARDFAVVWLNLPWHYTVLLDIFTLPVVMGITLHLVLSLIALGKLFVQGPNQTELTVFSEEMQPAAPLAQEEVFSDEVALVED